MTTPTPDSNTPQGENRTGNEEQQTIGSAEGQQTDQVRSLAKALAQKTGSALEMLKGVVTAVDMTGTPPTLSMQLSGDTTTTIAGVRFLTSYSPVVNDVVVVLKDGSDLLVLGQYQAAPSAAANGWVTMTLGTGFTHNGNSNGDLQYRIVLEHGERKMQWRGGVAISGTQIAIGTLPAGSRPTVKRSVLVARDMQGGTLTAQVDFLTDGTMTLIGPNVGVTGVSSSGGGNTNSVDPNDNTGGVLNPYGGFSGGGDPQTSGPTIVVNNGDTAHQHLFNHTHGVTGSHSHTTPDHTHTMTNAAHPDWLSFNGLEIFMDG